MAKVMMIETLGSGGIAHYTYNLMGSLARKRIWACLFTAANYEFLGERSEYRVYPCMFRLANRVSDIFPYLRKERPLPTFFRRFIKIAEYPLNVFQARSVCKRESITHIHLQSVNWIEIMMVLVFKASGIRSMYTIHNVNPHHKKLRIYHKVIYRVMYGLCDGIIIHSEKGKEEVAELFGVKRGKIAVIPHGDYKFFLPDRKWEKSDAKRKLGIPESFKTILFFGAIRANKGLDLILSALPHVRESIEEVKLLIVGEPWESYGRYEKIIQKHRLEENIYEYLKYVPNQDVPLFFFASDIVVLPYREITHSGILQMAYAFSKPVICTDLDGFKETVEDGKNGFIVPVGNERYLARKIVEVLGSETTIRQMGKYSRYLADTRYSWESIAKKTVGVYNGVKKLGEDYGR